MELRLRDQQEKKASLFDRWIRKCDAELEEEEEEEEVQDGSKVSSLEQVPDSSAAESARVSSASSQSSSQPRFRHDWYQTVDQVVVTVMAKKQDPSNVHVEFLAQNLVVTIDIPDGSGSSYVLDLELFDEIDPERSSYRLTPYKLEVKMRKKEAYQWSTLEKPLSDAAYARSSFPSSSATSSGVPSAYASGKDWNAIEQELKKKEEEEKPEGEEALNALFRQIYRNANEDTRRAMNKSFQTSGGTVLSTNWGEVGKTDYEKDRQAPEGMEWRNWEGDKLDKEGKPMHSSGN